MKITDVRVRQLEGSIESSGVSREERLRLPFDIYPKFKARRVVWGRSTQSKDGRVKVRGSFVQIDTDEGVSGIGLIGLRTAPFYINTQFKPILIGQDPMAIELLWDQMYRSAFSESKGDGMHAISSIDIALWDLKGKALGQPVYKLLGGPVQDKIPAYAQALGYSLEPEKIKERIKGFLRDGYRATKWYFTEGPTDGPEGVKKNIELIKTLREAAGEDVKIMLDCYSSWDVPYAIKMIELIKEYHPYWIEEPVLSDLPESYARVRANSPILIAGGEHVFTRWGAKRFLDVGALDVFNVEPVFAGGISEGVKMCTLASAYDVKVVLHGRSVPVSTHISFAHSSALIPMIEYQTLLQERGQFFLKEMVKPVNGFITPPTSPGIFELDESKIESEQDVKDIAAFY